MCLCAPDALCCIICTCVRHYLCLPTFDPCYCLQLDCRCRSAGEYNCFLNAIIQALWHLSSFRGALLALTIPPAAATAAAAAGGSAAQDLGVLRALCSTFRALATQPDARVPIAKAESPACAPQPPAAAGAQAVSPAELRGALDAFDAGQAAVRIEKGEMHDAAEVLGHILDCLHRAEVRASASTSGGGAPALVTDITLPQRVKLASGGGTVAAGGTGTGRTSGATPSYAAAATQPLPQSTVHQVFGLDVQVPCTPEGAGDSDGAGGKKLARSKRSSAQLPTPSGSAGGAGAGTGHTSNGGAPASSPGSAGGAQEAQEALLFTKFYHLVYAQGLRNAMAAATQRGQGQAGVPWEQLLASAEAGGDAPAVATTGTAAAPARAVLLRRPRVLTLSLVWESPQASMDAIKGTLAALGPQLEVPLVVGVPSTPAAAAVWPVGQGSVFSLRSVICYVGHHYVAFALSEELNMWLLFDDAAMSVIGKWTDVCRTMLTRRMQPSLLMYEGGSHVALQQPGR